MRLAYLAAVAVGLAAWCLGTLSVALWLVSVLG